MEDNKDSKQLTDKDSQNLDKLKKNTYSFLLLVFVVFATCAVSGGLIGLFIDRHFEIKPYGSLISLFISYLVAWVIIFPFYKKMKNKK